MSNVHGAGSDKRALARVPMAAWLLALLVLVACVYLPGLHGGYVFDDYPNIVDNTALHVTPGASAGEWLAAAFASPSDVLVRPLAMLSFAANHALTGLDPYWMKLTNLAIHLLNTVLVFGLVRALLGAMPARAASRVDIERRALWVAAAWSLVPINLMAVLFVVQRMESLSHTFVFAGLWLYLSGRARQRAGRRGWGAIGLGLVGCTLIGALAKESALLLPLYAFGIEWALLRFGDGNGRVDRRLLLAFGALLVIPAIAGLAWELPRAFNAGAYVRRDFSLVDRLLTEGRVLVDYVHWTLLPSLGQLSLYHDDYVPSRGLLAPPSTLLAFVLLGAMAGAALWLRRRRPLMALGLAWF